MIKVCWIQHASEYPLVEQIAGLLRDEGIFVKFISTTLDVHNHYLKNGFESFFISEIFNQDKSLSQEELSYLDIKYGPPGIRAVCDSDIHLRYFFGDNHGAKEQVIARAYRFWEKFLHQHEIRYIIARESASFASRSAHTVGKFYGIPFMDMQIGPSKKHFIMRDVEEIYVWKELVNVLSDGPKMLTANQKKMVLDFIKERIGKDNGGDNIPIRFVPVSILRSLRSFLGMHIRDTKRNRKSDPIKIAAFRYGKYRLLKKVFWRYVTQLFFHYDRPLENEKFVYFPFYSGKETSYLTNDPYWAKNEPSLIEEVANSLPVGFWLYTKEHPYNPGDLSLFQLRKLQKILNVRVLHPSLPSQDLINKSYAVVVLQGTAGWEAFLSRKPVVALSTTYYTYSPLAHKVGNISQLHSVLWNAIKQGSAIYDSREDEWLWFIYCVITSCGKGVFVNLDPPYGFSTEFENSQKIAIFIASKIKRDLGIAY